MGFQRARTDKQIENRQLEIMNAAAILFDKGGHEAVTFTAISDLTNFTRPAIYKYFATKEAILLAILLDDVNLWARDLKAQFKLNQVYSTYDISMVWAEILGKHQRMNALYAILYTILERNVSLEIMVDFKKDLFSKLYPLHGLLTQLFPNASFESFQHFMMQQYAIAMGFYAMCYQTPLQEEAMKIIHPDYVPMDFVREIQTAIYPLMKGLE